LYSAVILRAAADRAEIKIAPTAINAIPKKESEVIVQDPIWLLRFARGGLRGTRGNNDGERRWLLRESV
jgi:hypothetical protein